MQKYFNNITNRAGVAVPNALITVTTTAGGALATLYADNGVTTKANPVRTDSNGYFEFYAADGRYNLAIAGTGITGQVITDVLIEDPADGGLPSSAITFTQAGTGAVLRTAQDKMRDVVSIKDFGAIGDWNGITGTDDGAALQAAVNAAFALSATGRPVTIDGANKIFMTNTPISYPAGGDVMLKCKIVAGNTFPTSRYLVEANSQAGGLVHHDLQFDVVLDARHRGGCLLIDNYIRVSIKDSCRFFHFSTDGLRLDKTLDSHECNIGSAWAFEYLYGEPGYTAPTATSCGFRINSFDNTIGNVVSYYTGKGMIVNGQYNLISKAHLGGVQYGLHITSNAAFSSFAQCYVDSAAVLWENPWNAEMIGCKFLHNTSNAAFSFVVLKPLAAGLAINGLKIKSCSFHNINATVINSVTVDTSGGSFNPAIVQNCYIGENSFVNTAYAYTKFTTSLYQNAATAWTFNVGPYLPFGNVQLVKHSFYDASNVKPASNISSISGNTVVVTNSIAGNGTVFLEVDVNTGTS